MSVSRALECSANTFNMKYACDFAFSSFEASVKEFTLLRPNGGWRDVYKATFGSVYKRSLENAALGKVDNLNGEAMLDDFEYTLMRPYANESAEEIKHKPYVGMDRLTRLQYLDRLTVEAPQNLVELYAEKYRKGTLTIRQMRATGERKVDGGERNICLAGYLQALEAVSLERSPIWRVLHPFRRNAEKREVVLLKKALVEATCGEMGYGELVRAVYAPFDGYRRVTAYLRESMARAKEELAISQKMNTVIRESLN